MLKHDQYEELCTLAMIGEVSPDEMGVSSGSGALLCAGSLARQDSESTSNINHSTS